MNQFEIVNINKIYNKNNYKIIRKSTNHNKCYIFFSSHGIYYPNTNKIFDYNIIKKNRFEWEEIAKDIKIADKLIYVRDIYKSWYHFGINNKISTIDKLVLFLKKETKNFKNIYCIGSSAGGYIATIVGSKFKNSIILNFSGQFNLKLEDFNFKNSKYIKINKLIKSNLFYFYSGQCELDIKQFLQIKKNNKIFVFKFLNKNHGVILPKPVIKELISLDKMNLINLYNRCKNKNINKYFFSLIFLNFIELFYYLLINNFKKFLHFIRVIKP
jgi:hypothetical protein